MQTGAELIAAERRRQTDVENWTAEHDDRHTNEELESAAVALILGPVVGRQYWPWFDDAGKPVGFKPRGYRPAERIADLTRAGALLAAEIDRLQRLIASQEEIQHTMAHKSPPFVLSVPPPPPPAPGLPPGLPTIAPPPPPLPPSPGCCPNCGSPWARGIEMGVSSREWFPTCGCSVVAGPGTIRYDPVPCDDPGLLWRTRLAEAATAGDTTAAELLAEAYRAWRADPC